MTISASQRINPLLAYTGADPDRLEELVNRYVTQFIPAIIDPSLPTSGREFIRIIQGVVGILVASVDMNAREAKIHLAQEIYNILHLAPFFRYRHTVAATATETFTRIGGPAPADIPIPRWTVLQSSEAPAKSFAVKETTILSMGQTSVDVPLVQGTVVSGFVLGISDGSRNQVFTLSTIGIDLDSMEVKVSGVTWARPTDNHLFDSEAESEHWFGWQDSDGKTYVSFGDGEFGKIPANGSSIKATYVVSSGTDGNTAKGLVTVLSGPLSGTFSVTNAAAATGGDSPPSIYDTEPYRLYRDALVREIEGEERSQWRVVAEEDILDMAGAYPGVYDVVLAETAGNYAKVVVTPEGGGYATPTLLTSLENWLSIRSVLGNLYDVVSIAYAEVRLRLKVYLQSDAADKAWVKQLVLDALEAYLDYTHIAAGEGFRRSDLDHEIESLEDETLVENVDAEIMTRIPRVEKSNASAPDIIGSVIVNSTCSYDEWVIRATAAGEFQVVKSGSILDATGLVGVAYTTIGGEITFTLGALGDTLTPGDIWSFATSAYNGNIEIPRTERLSFSSANVEVLVYWKRERERMFS